MYYLFVTVVVIAIFVAYGFMQNNSGDFADIIKNLLDKFHVTPPTSGGPTPPKRPAGPAANTQMKQGDVLVIVGNQHRILSPKQAPEVIIGRDANQSDMITSEYCSGQHCHLSLLPNGQLHVNVFQTNSNGTWKKEMSANGESNPIDITGTEENITLPENHLPVYLLLSSPDDADADVVTLIKL